MFTPPIPKSKAKAIKSPTGTLTSLGSRVAPKSTDGGSVALAQIMQYGTQNSLTSQSGHEDQELPGTPESSMAPRDFSTIPTSPPEEGTRPRHGSSIFLPPSPFHRTSLIVKAIDQAARENGTAAPPAPAAFSAALSRARIRDDAAADRSARLLGADAVAFREEVLFRSGRYAPGTESGRALLAHELTHLAHQMQSGHAHPQRSVAGDVLKVQFTRAMAEAMTNAELDQQMDILRAHLQTSPNDEGSKQNLAVLEDVVETRQGTAHQDAAQPADGSQAQKPKGNALAQQAPGGEEQHGKLWWLLHKVGLTMTKHERADILRKGWGKESGVVITDDEGNPVNVERLSDDEVIALDKQLRGRPISHTPPAAGIASAVTWPLVTDAAGKIHGELPNAREAQEKIKSMKKEDLEQSAEELKKSIANRKAENARLGENSPKGPAHRARIGEEEDLLRAIEKKLSGS